MTTNQEMAVSSHPHIPIPGSGSSPATCHMSGNSRITIFVSSPPIRHCCVSQCHCMQIAQFVSLQWMVNVSYKWQAIADNLSLLSSLCYINWLILSQRAPTHLPWQCLRPPVCRCCHLVLNKSPSLDDIQLCAQLTSHRGVWVSRSVDAHGAHVGARTSLPVLMASVCVNLKSALLQSGIVSVECRVSLWNKIHCLLIFSFLGN